MVTMAVGYGTFAAPPTCRVLEPPAITKVTEALHEVLMTFVNESVQATAIGFKALDAKKFVTLDELEAALLKR